MKSRITTNDRRLILIVLVAFLIAGVALTRVFGSAAVMPFVAVCLVVGLWAQFEVVRRVSEETGQLRKDTLNDFRQIESLLSLFSTLRPELPLPPTRDHSLSPDLLRNIIDEMLAKPPQLVVELGSGASTVFIAHCLRRLGGGRLVSIDHDAEFTARTRELLTRHGLEQYATILHCPLVDVTIEGERFRWYDIAAFSPEAPIDLLVVDGPPYHVHPLARYPAIPVMLPFLAADARIIVDDAVRPEELRIVKMWRKEFPFFRIESLETEKGGLLLVRSASRAAHSSAGEIG